MEYRFTNEEIEINSAKRGTWVKIAEEFMASELKNCVISCGSAQEKQNCSNSLRQYIKKHNLSMTMFIRNMTVYLIKY